MQPKFKWHLLYVCVFIILLLNLVLDNYTSVYPSLVFPSFSTAPVIKNEVKFSVSELFAVTGTSDTFALDEKLLFYDLYSLHSEDILKTILKRVNKSRRKDSLFIKNYFKTHIDSAYHKDVDGVYIVTGKKTLYTKTGEIGSDISDKRTSYISLK